MKFVKRFRRCLLRSRPSSHGDPPRCVTRVYVCVCARACADRCVRPSQLDALVFSHLLFCLRANVPNNPLAAVIRKYANLIKYNTRTRMHIPRVFRGAAG
jgi:hypothetical protein